VSPAARALAALLLAAPSLAGAASFDGTQRIDAYNGLVISFSRVTGLAGAYVGVAEGQDGAVFNPAATAHRERNLDRDWDWDFVLNWLLPGTSLQREDLGNEGRVDPGLSSRDSIQAGLELELGRLGLGILVRGWVLTAPGTAGDQLLLSTQDVALSAGWSFLHDSLVVGADIAAAAGTVGYQPAGAGLSKVGYGSTSHLRAGALWKPRGASWRLGLLLDPGQTVGPKHPDDSLPGVAIPRAFAFPAIISVGGSLLLGRNAHLYNEPPPVERRDHPELGPPRAFEPGGTEPVMVSAQLDLVGATPGAVSSRSFLHQQSEEAVPSGAHPSLEPHLGVEWTAIDRWLVVRGGTYVEPSRLGASPRGHATLGAQTRVPLASWLDLRLSFAADLAPRFANVSLGLGFWHDLTPRPPPAAPAADHGS